MRDVQDRDAPSHELAEDAEEARRLALVQRRVRLVEDQQTRFLEQDPGQLDELPLTDRKPAHGNVGIDLETHALQHRYRAGRHRVPGYDTTTHGGSAHEQVREDRAMREEAQLLVHDPDAPLARRSGRPERQCLAVERDGPGVWDHAPREHLHQRRLAGAVLTDDGMDGAGGDVQVEACDGDDAPVPLPQVTDPTAMFGSPFGTGDGAGAGAMPTPTRVTSVRDPDTDYLDSFSMGSTLVCHCAMTVSTSGW
jgi:hypothetical protein